MAIKYREIPSATESTLVLNSLQSYESGFYTCVLTNDCGTATATAAELTVLNSEDYAEIYVSTFQELFDVSGITGKKDIVLCPGTYTMTDDLTVPVTKTLRFLQGAIIATTGQTFTCNGTIVAGTRQQIFSGTGSTVLKNTVNPFWFGATGDGTTDDTTAIQNAVNAVTTNGGTVYFPTPAIYNIKGEITITSYYPVYLVSDMSSGSGSLLYPNASCISIGSAISGSVFKVNLYNGGGFRRLYFKDPSGFINNNKQGTRAITAAIETTRFIDGVIEDCAFDGILGSAIKTTTCNRTKIEYLHARNCGTPTQPVIYLTGSSVATSSQAIGIIGPHIEVCYGDYIYLDSYSYSNKVIGGQFEADADIALSSRSFIYNKGSKTIISDCVFNRNDEVQVYLHSGTATVANCIFSAGTAHVNQIYLAAQRNVITNNKIIGALFDVTAINDVGGYNTFTGNKLYYCGNVILGASSTWQGDIYQCKTTEAYAIYAGGSNSIVSNSLVRGSATSGGIHAASAVNVTGNTIVDNAGIGLYCTETTALVNGNYCARNTAGDMSFTKYPHGLSPDSNYALDAAYPLYYSDTWNPAEIANGSYEDVDITVTGAAVGDSVKAVFPMLVSSAAQGGMYIDAFVYAANSVKVSIINSSGGAVNLDSGTLVVKVTKK